MLWLKKENKPNVKKKINKMPETSNSIDNLPVDSIKIL